MEIFFYIFIALVIFYILGSFGGNKKKSPSSSSRALKNWLDNEKKYNDMQECVDIIGNYLYQNNSKNYEEAAESFPSFIDSLINHYKKEKKEYTKSLVSTQKWFDTEIAKDVDEDDMKELKEEKELQDKRDNKIIGWYEREIEKINTDLKPIMKKYMSFSLKEDLSPNQLWDIDLPKELPDSYFD
jgi:hypothetical protein